MLSRVITIICLLLGFTLVTLPLAKADDDLLIQPVVQQTQLWCWAAVSEMVLQHYHYGSVNPGGNFQCGVVAMLGGVCNISCDSCVTSIGSLQNLVLVLRGYQETAHHFGVAGDSLRLSMAGHLSPRQIANEIEGGDPIIAGISPSGMGQFYPPSFGEHLALIVGYENSRHAFDVIVNDPFPYAYVGYDPYLHAGAEMLEPGQYLINYDIFRQQLGYKDSIYFH